jgi:hypothetical protein
MDVGRAILPDGANPSKGGDAKPSAFGLFDKAVGLPGTAAGPPLLVVREGQLGSFPAD